MSINWRTIYSNITAQNIAAKRYLLAITWILALIYGSSISSYATAFPYTDGLVNSPQNSYQFLSASSFLEELCGDGLDNDDDGATDCDDSDCGPQIQNVSFTVPSGCSEIDGSMNITVTGGFPPYRFSINNGLSWQSSGGIYTNLANASYHVRVANFDESCLKNHGVVEVYNPDSPLLDSVVHHNPSLCFLNDGSINIYARGQNIEYSIDGGNNYSAQSSYSDLPAGIYRVRVRMNECVRSYQNITLIEPACASNIVIPSGSPSERCLFVLNEVISLDLEGSTSSGVDVDYVITDAEGMIEKLSSTPNFAGISNPGNHIAYILGVESGMSVTGLTVGEYIQSVSIASTCYEWSDGYMFEVCPTTETDCFDGFDNDGDGFLDCEDNDCSPEFVMITPQDPTECETDNGSITVSVENGRTSSYVYSIDFGQTWQSSSTFSNLAPGLYQILAANNDESCPRTSVDVILEAPLPPSILNVLSSNSSSCSEANGTITILATGATALEYSINGGQSFQASGEYSDLSGGTYQIQVRNESGTCMISDDNVILTDPQMPSINNVSFIEPSQCGATDGSITISASGSGLEFSINGGNTYQASNTFDILGEGSYNIAVRNDDGSCRVLSSQNPIEMSSGSVVDVTDVSVTQPSTCNGTTGSITITATGSAGLQYSINGGNSYQGSNVFTNLSGGSYPIVVANSDGSCPEEYSTISLVDETPGTITNVTTSNPSDCNLTNGSITISASNGSSNLQYRLDNSNWQNSNSFENLNAGNYTVSIRNVGGTCEVTGDQVSIEDPVAPSISSVSFEDDTRCDVDNGTIAITASGTGALEYSIDGGSNWSSQSSFDNLSAGSYAIAVRNSDGSCMVTNETIQIIENTVAISVSLDKTDPSCHNDTDGSVSTNVTGGVEPLEYAWSDNSDDNIVNDLGAGNISVIVTDANGCTAEASTTLNNPTELTSSAVSQDDELCNNCLIVTAQGGTQPYEYGIDGDSYQSSSTISGISGGTYTVYVRDAGGCVSTSQVELVDLNPLSCQITILSQVSCNGGSDASVRLVSEDGDAPFEYSDNDINYTSNNTFSDLDAGTHVFYIRDNASNASSCQITLDNPTSISASVNLSTAESCFGENDAVIEITATGGTGNLEFSSDGDNFQSSNVMVGMAAGTYNFVIRDENNCSIIEPFTIDGASEIICQVAQNNGVSCEGNNDGNFVVQASGGAGGFQYTMDGETNTTGSFNNLGGGTYTINVVDAEGCTSICTATIDQPDALACNVIEKRDVTCGGDADGYIQFGVQGGVAPITYQLGNETNNTGIFESLLGGFYEVTAQDANGCISNCTVTIIEHDAIEITSTEASDITCNGENDGSVEITVAGGSGNYGYLLNGSTVTSPSLGALQSGTYEFVVSDDNGCTAASEFTIDEPSALTCSSTVLSHVICAAGGQGSVRISAQGGEGNKTFTVAGISNSSGIFDNLSGGTYTATVSDDNGCLSFCDFEIIEPSAISCEISNSSDVSCAGAADGVINVEVTGGVAPYTYSLDGFTFGSSNSFMDLEKGSYIVDVRDANGCETSCSVTISEPFALECIINDFVDVNCSDEANGRIQVSGNGGSAPYQYSLNNASFVDNGTFENLGAGSYNVRVRDMKGCISICDLQVSEPSDLACNVLEITPTACAGPGTGTVTVEAIGGQSPYSFSVNGTDYQESNTITGLEAGTYEISIKDAGNCVVTCAEITIETSGGVVCEVAEIKDAACGDGSGGSITMDATGGTAPYEYSIDGETFQTSNVLESLLQGNYTITVRDAAGCISECEATITVGSNATPSVTCTQVVHELGCNPIDIPSGNDLIALGLITAEDSDGTATVQVVDESISNLGCEYITTVRFNAIDNCGLTGPSQDVCSIEIIWIENDAVTINCPSKLELECSDDNNETLIANWLATVTADETCGGETTFTNTYDSEGFTSGCNDASGSQMVTFTVEDACGNTASCIVEIEIIDTGLPTLSDLPEDINIAEGQEIPAAATLTATDDCGTAEVTYSEETVTQNCGYVIQRTWTATDQCENTTSHIQRVNVSESLVASIQLDSDINCSGELGAASVTVSSGAEPYEYNWSNGADDASVDNLAGGSHTVTVTDALECSVILGVNIAEVQELTIEINEVQSVACNLRQTGTISYTVTGGTPDYIVTWDDSSSELERSGLVSGTYSVSVIDANGCQSSAQHNLAETGDCTASIVGDVWEDNDRSGTRDAEDGPLANVLIHVVSDQGVIWDSARSDEQGAYTLSALPAGDFYLEAIITNDLGITIVGEDNQFDNITGRTDIISLADGQQYTASDLGGYRLGKVRGFTWSDANQNGVFDVNEAGLGSVSVSLYDNGGELLASTFSDDDGAYAFNNLPPGQYVVQFNKDAELQFSPTGESNDPTKGSYANPETGRTDVIDIVSGVCYEDVNAGIFGLFDLELSILAGNTSPAENERVAFMVTIENKGDIDASGVSVEAVIGDGLGNVIAITNDGVLDGQVVTWENISVNSGSSIVLAFRAEVSAYDPVLSYVTSAEISDTRTDDQDSTPGNASDGLNEDDEDSVTTIPAPDVQSDLSLVMTNTILEDGSVKYTIELYNDGPDEATGVEVVNYIPQGLLENIRDIEGDGMLDTDEIMWDIAVLGSGDQMTMSFIADIPTGIGRVDIKNAAEVAYADQFDPNSTPGNFSNTPSENDEAISIISINQQIDLELEINTELGDKMYGDQVTISINVANKGLDNVAQAQIANYLPFGLQNISDISGNGRAVNGVILWDVYDLGVNDETTMSFTAEVVPAVSVCDPYLNIAEVSMASAEDSDSAPNNHATASEDDDDFISYNISEETCLEMEARVILEGAYLKNDDKMHNTLYINGYLPGQIPFTFFGNQEEEGQPYINEPWNHCGDEGDELDGNVEGNDNFAGYPEASIDWVLISIRADKNPSSTVCRKAAIVLDNGDVQFVEGFDCCGVDDAITYYVVVEHRNHLPVMSASKVAIVDGKMTYDFTNKESYVGLLGSGQKEVNPGKYAMIAGNGEQRDYIESGDINVNDLSRWSTEEGNNSGYYNADLDLNGDVNVQDKSVVLRNFGMFTDVISKKD